MEVKTNKEFGSSRNEGNKGLEIPRNEGNKTAKNEINEVLSEEDEGQYNKSLHINREELNDDVKKTSREKVLE